MLIGTSEERWTIALIVTAGVLATLLVRASRGNWAYGLTVEWALTAIVVANLLSRGPYPAIAASAAGAGVVVLTALLYGDGCDRPRRACCEMREDWAVFGVATVAVYDLTNDADASGGRR